MNLTIYVCILFLKILHQDPMLDVLTFLKSSEEVTENPTDKTEEDDKVLGSFIDTYEVTPEAKRRLWFLSYPTPNPI